jgi:hypothetical protein
MTAADTEDLRTGDVRTGSAARLAAGLMAGAHRRPATTFDPDQVAGLPEPARRWLTHAIAAGTPLAQGARITMHGEIRLAGWRKFTATQTLVPGDGYVWAARTRLAGIPVAGYDSFVANVGQMHWRMAGAIPVLSAVGSNVTLSAAGRSAAESVLVPTALVDAAWRPGHDRDTVILTRSIAGEEVPIRLRIDPDGALRSITMLRWGNPDGLGYGYCPFTVEFRWERRFDGITIPAELTARWARDGAQPGHHDFFRAHIDSAEFTQQRATTRPHSTGRATAASPPETCCTSCTRINS